MSVDQDNVQADERADDTAKTTYTVSSRNTHDEESPLLESRPPLPEPPVRVTGVRTVLAILLLGELISNADGTLVLAATGRISSEFDRLRDASWLSTGYTLGLCAAQPMYGKLSDSFGRKPLLLISYLLFGVGCIISGVGPRMWTVILGRGISGIGGAGIMTVSSVIIIDIVPRRDLASWRAYLNIAITFGRSIGGPLGGLLSETIGWRWLFLIQAPLVAVAAVLVTTRLKLKQSSSQDTSKLSLSKLRQVDFLGSGILAIAVVALTTLIDQGGKSFAWRSIWTAALTTAGVALLVAFVVVELCVAREPIFDLRILRRPNVASSYLISLLQVTAQLAMMFSVPLYFQVTQRASTTASGAHLIPAVVGNTCGGLFAGYFIRRKGHYKVLLAAAGIIASISYILLYLEWDGNTGWGQSMYIIPGGIGTGIAGASGFVAMTVMLKPEEMAMATAGYMLLISFAMTAGVTSSNTILGNEFLRQLQKNLKGPDSASIIQRATEDASYINGLHGHIRDVVVWCYVAGLKHTYILSLLCSLAASLVSLSIKSQQI